MVKPKYSEEASKKWRSVSAFISSDWEYFSNDKWNTQNYIYIKIKVSDKSAKWRFIILWECAPLNKLNKDLRQKVVDLVE